MLKYACKEQDTVVTGRITITSRRKKYFVLNDDKVIAEQTYLVLPATSKRATMFQDSPLVLSDPFGLLATLVVTYPKAPKKP